MSKRLLCAFLFCIWTHFALARNAAAEPLIVIDWHAESYLDVPLCK
jgi:hypothetical protein